MAIDLSCEELFPLADNNIWPKRHGKAPSIGARYRWASRGSNGIVLETLRMPWGKATSREAIARFITLLSSLDGNLIQATAGSGFDRAHRRRQADADKALDGFGV